MIDRSLDRLLTETAHSVRYPVAPDLRTRVAARAIGQAGRREGWPLWWRPALVAAVLLLVGAALVVTPSREAIGRFFGVEGSKIEVRPTPAPGETPVARPSPAGLDGLEPVMLEELGRRAGFAVRQPAGRGEPSGAYFASYGGHGVAVLSYEGFDLWQTRLQQEAYFGKMVEPHSILIETEVNGVPATWLSGSPHAVEFYLNPTTRIPSSVRWVERSTLIWRTDAAFYRIETDLSMEEAVRIAVTLP